MTMVVGVVVFFWLLLIVAIHLLYYNVYILMLLNLTPCLLLVMHTEKGSEEKYKTHNQEHIFNIESWIVTFNFTFRSMITRFTDYH